MTEYTIDGYVIIPPVSPWDKKEIVIPHMAYNSFSITAKHAWLKHMGTMEWDALKVNRWINAGYRLADATLTIKEPIND